MEAVSFGLFFSRLQRGFRFPAAGGQTPCPKGTNSVYNLSFIISRPRKVSNWCFGVPN